MCEDAAGEHKAKPFGRLRQWGGGGADLFNKLHKWGMRSDRIRHFSTQVVRVSHDSRCGEAKRKTAPYLVCFHRLAGLFQQFT